MRRRTRWKRRRSRRRREKGSGEASTRVKQMESRETFPRGGETGRHCRSSRQQRVKKETKRKKSETETDGFSSVNKNDENSQECR